MKLQKNLAKLKEISSNGIAIKHSDHNLTFNGILNTSDAPLNTSYAPLNQSNIVGIKNPKIVRMGKAAPISSVQMAKDLYRKDQTASQSSSRATA